MHVKLISGFVVTHMTCGVFGLAGANAVYNLLNGNRNPETWYLPYKIVLPFDRTTYSGHVFTLICHMMAGYTYIFTMSAVVTYFVSCCFYIEGCFMHFKDKMRVINEKIKQIKTKSDYDHIQNLYRDAISFHVKIVEYVFYKCYCFMGDFIDCFVLL